MRRLTILIVDDSPIITTVVGALVRRQGHDALIAASGDEALAALEAGGIDCVLLDLSMPGLDGYGVAARLAGRAHPPLIAMSADPLDAGDPRAAGFAGFLAKPVRPQDLGALLAQPQFQGS